MPERRQEMSATTTTDGDALLYRRNPRALLIATPNTATITLLRHFLNSCKLPAVEHFPSISDLSRVSASMNHALLVVDDACLKIDSELQALRRFAKSREDTRILIIADATPAIDAQRLARSGM